MDRSEGEGDPKIGLPTYSSWNNQRPLRIRPARDRHSAAARTSRPQRVYERRGTVYMRVAPMSRTQRGPVIAVAATMVGMVATSASAQASPRAGAQTVAANNGKTGAR